jgi:predicted acylesterase/phospholipase RssA
MDASVVSKPTGSPNTTPIAKGETKLINLSLQGGGAHGAFTSGVLDCLVEGDCIEFHGISATSSDAMNATVFPSQWPPAIDRFTGDVIAKMVVICPLLRRLTDC